MRSVKVKDVNKAALSGSKVTRSNPAAPAVPDLKPEINVLKSKQDSMISSIRILEDQLSSLSGDTQVIRSMMAQISSLKGQVEEMKKASPVTLSRAPNSGYITAVSCGGKTYKFNRNKAGFTQSVDVIQVG